MPTYVLTALVLRKTKLGETDLILTLLGSDGALYKAVAKGARKPGSKFGGRGEPATILRALVGSGRSLDVISEAKTLTSHHELREDYDASVAGSVILDFAATVSMESLVDPRFYALTSATLDTLEACIGQKERIRLLVTAYLLKAAAMHGYRPEFGDGVYEDGDEAEGSGFVGGYRCDTHMMRHLAYLLSATLVQLQGSDLAGFPPVGELFDAVRMFVVANIPARLRALEYYADIEH